MGWKPFCYACSAAFFRHEMTRPLLLEYQEKERTAAAWRRGSHNTPQWVPAARIARDLSKGARWGVFCGLRPTPLPCQRTGATCRDAGPPPPTAAGRCAVGAAQGAASAGAAREVPRRAGVTGFTKYQFSEGGRLWWPPEKLAPPSVQRGQFRYNWYLVSAA